MSAAGETSFGDNPVAYLQQIASRDPSVDLLTALAGRVASTMQEFVKDPNCSNVSACYLQAAAKQLPIAAADLSVAASKPQQKQGSEMEADLKSFKILHEVVEAVGFAVTGCKPRSLILQTGILPVMANMLPTSSAANAISSPSLSPIHVEFLQACIYAEQYNYAQRKIANEWPIPSPSFPVSVKHVLRYFYLRGTIHMGCGDYQQAVRCFWTCLSGVPSEIVSTVTIAAWKKMVILQSILQTFDGPSLLYQQKQNRDLGTQQTGLLDLPDASASKESSPPPPLIMPRDIPTCTHRFFTTGTSVATASGPKGVSTSLPESQSPESMHVVENSGNQHMADGDAGGGESSTQQSSSEQKKQKELPARGVRAYSDLVHAFVCVDQHAFDRILSEPLNQQQYRQDGNMGIIKLCQRALLHRHVFLLSTMYSVISLPDLQKHLALPSVEDVKILLLQLSADHQWAIQISQETGFVSFPRFPTSVPTGEMLAEDLVQLTELIHKRDMAITSSAKYSAYIQKSKSGKSAKDKKPPGPRGVEDI